MSICSAQLNRFMIIYLTSCVILTAPQPDPNAPKPEGGTLTPVPGEPLVVSCVNSAQLISITIREIIPFFNNLYTVVLSDNKIYN